jgi:hypothetical protein
MLCVYESSGVIIGFIARHNMLCLPCARAAWRGKARTTDKPDREMTRVRVPACPDDFVPTPLCPVSPL